MLPILDLPMASKKLESPLPSLTIAISLFSLQKILRCPRKVLCMPPPFPPPVIYKMNAALIYFTFIDA